MSENTIKHFIEQKIEQDLASGYYPQPITTRFPPEPNGYLHIGHAKSICLNFTMAEQYNGVCHLRFDDTNPVKEDEEYINAIIADIKWLGFSWDALHHTSDYFEKLYDYALTLIKQGHAYICSLSADEIRQYRGTLTEPGKNSPYRERSIEENLLLFTQMRDGKFTDGEQVLRAKIDMHSGNINLRDPIIYRILHAKHPHVGDKWCIYPTYDFAHALSDAIENITHSLCTLEFQDHRPLYNWFIEKLFPAPLPQQIEFSRLNVNYTITSKRKLKALIDANKVSGWDDPRMPTLIGLRRRGFTPQAIKNFCKNVGISKADSVIDMTVLEECVRDDLNQHAPRVMCVVNPLKVTITTLADDHHQVLKAANHPQQESLGTRDVILSKTIYIEQDDFMEVPEKKYFRLAPGQEVRLRYGYIIKCEEVVKDLDTGAIIELKCSHDPDTLGKNPTDRKVKGVIHWVSATVNRRCTVRIYDRLFADANPQQTKDHQALCALLNPNSYAYYENCYIEQCLINTNAEAHYQFERLGYFAIDRFDSSTEKLVFNRVVSLRDSWVKR